MLEPIYYVVDMERTKLNEIFMYWKQNRHGYTSKITEAGVFTHEEACDMVRKDIGGNTVMIDARRMLEMFEMDNL